MAAISQRYYIPMLKEQVRLFIKYCEPCQKNNTQKLDKCPHKMKSIKIEEEVWTQMDELTVAHLHVILNFKGS